MTTDELKKLLIRIARERKAAGLGTWYTINSIIDCLKEHFTQQGQKPPNITPYQVYQMITKVKPTYFPAFSGPRCGTWWNLPV